uniref:ODAD1 central coiled coil region domain-containing protein n=1 Tax=Odontella aurita TaxID=265563 RepID=A0A7S4J3Y8_9STRA|mmetsp:Transcript_37849/g.113148  ORF Transcript_37849/g.113148 Transcript_37849/m.113148 type:complete len:358 (+) Transcript_37849:262-1335(+)
MNPREQIQMQDAIAALQARGDLFTRQLINEKQRVAQLQAKLNEVNEQINSVRESNKKRAISLLNMHTTTANVAYRRVDGLDPTRLARDNQRMLVRNLEGRLNKALVRQNGIENENNVIRDKINKLRRKVRNDNLSRASMAKELESIQEQMDDIMRRAALATDHREKIVEKKNQILRENIDEQEKFHAEYQKLCKSITDQAQMLEDSITGVANDVVSKSNKSEGSGQSSGEATEGINPIEEMRALDDKIAELDKQYEANRRALQKTEEKIQEYEENFKQLREVSGLTSADEIISAFVKNEEESFSIFNYIQAVNQESDIMLEQRTQLEQEIEALRTEQVNKENQRFSIINEYKGNLFS